MWVLLRITYLVSVNGFGIVWFHGLLENIHTPTCTWPPPPITRPPQRNKLCAHFLNAHTHTHTHTLTLTHMIWLCSLLIMSCMLLVLGKFAHLRACTPFLISFACYHSQLVLIMLPFAVATAFHMELGNSVCGLLVSKTSPFCTLPCLSFCLLQLSYAALTQNHFLNGGQNQNLLRDNFILRTILKALSPVCNIWLFQCVHCVRSEPKVFQLYCSAPSWETCQSS